LNAVTLFLTLLGLFAYRDLLRFKPERTAALDTEQFFFAPDDTAAPLVLALSLWLLYRRRHRLFSLPREGGPVWLVVALFAAGASVFAWSSYTGARDLLVVSLIFNVLGIACAFAGPRAMRVIALPVAFLVFAIPMPAPLLTALVYKAQILTAEYAGFLLFLLGIPAFVSGDLIYQSSQTFQVIENCSGIRSIETLTMLAVLMVDLFERRPRHALIVVAIAPFVAFALNGFRALTLILNPHSKIVAIHNLQGIVILLVGMTLLYVVDGLLERWLGDPGPHPVPRPAARPGTPWSWPLWGSAASLLACAALSFWVAPWQPPSSSQPLLAEQIPSRLGAWREQQTLDSERLFLERVGLRQTLYRRYARPRGPSVDLFVAAGDLDQRYRSPFSPKTAFPGSGWLIEEDERRELEPGGPEASVRVLRKGTRRLLTQHWYEGTGGLADEVARTLLALDSSPLRRERLAVVVRMSTPLDDPGAASRAAAEDRLSEIYESLRDPLRRFGTMAP